MSVSYKDYYKTLNVDRKADGDTIQKAFRKLARKYHPDVNQEPGAEEKFKELNEAYEVLKDPEKRARYDSLGANWQSGDPFAGFRNAHGRSGNPFGGNPGAGGFGGGNFSDFFETLFGGAGFGDAHGGYSRLEAASHRHKKAKTSRSTSPSTSPMPTTGPHAL